VFDTGIVVDFLVGDKRAKAFFDEHVLSGQVTPVLSPQSVSELFMATRNKKEEAELEQWLSAVFDIAPLSYEVGKEAGLLKRSNGIRASDAIIASTAKILRVPLVTTKPELYRRSGLRTFKPYA
jgi:predicted nucleic acid-binding protein